MYLITHKRADNLANKPSNNVLKSTLFDGFYVITANGSNGASSGDKASGNGREVSGQVWLNEGIIFILINTTYMLYHDSKRESKDCK